LQILCCEAVGKDGTGIASYSDHRLETAMPLRALALLLALITLSLFAPRAQAQSFPLVDPGKLTWGSAATFPPFEYIDDGKPVGFDVEMVAAITAKMKLQSSIMTMEFKGLIPALLGGRLDAIVSGMYINPERSQVVDFVPYLRVGNQILVAKGNPLHVGQKMDLCGHRIAAPVGTVYEKAAKELSTECTTAGKPEISLLSLTSTAVCALTLKEGRADAIIASTATNAALMHESPDAYETAGDTFDNGTLLGIGLHKDQPAIKAAVEVALKAVVADGTYAALVKKYGLPPSSSIF
jgi:polar amino acid transport system substrate-binding protein